MSGNEGSPVWSPDGRRLILRDFPDADKGNFQLDLSADPQSRKIEPILAGSPGRRMRTVRVSPDGGSLIYFSGDAVYACPYPPSGQQPYQIGILSGGWPFFSRDGRILYAFSGNSERGSAGGTLTAALVFVTTWGSRTRLGPPAMMFDLTISGRIDSNPGAASGDGKRILSLSTDSMDEARTQIIRLDDASKTMTPLQTIGHDRITSMQ